MENLKPLAKAGDKSHPYCIRRITMMKLDVFVYLMSSSDGGVCHESTLSGPDPTSKDGGVREIPGDCGGPQRWMHRKCRIDCPSLC